jgi:kumamolisin
MASSAEFRALLGSAHPHPEEHQKLRRTDGAQVMKVTLQLRRRPGHAKLQPEHVLAEASREAAGRPSRAAFATTRGADPDELRAVETFAKAAGLEVTRSDPATRSVEVRGTADQISQAFDVELNDYQYEHGVYRSHDGPVRLSAAIADYVEAVIGLTNRKVRARHFSTIAAARRRATLDPPNTRPLTPTQVAAIYRFPAGDGAGQTIGLYEMETGDGPAGYAASDIAATFQALGVQQPPRITDVPVNGTGNSGQSDGETGLDITVAGAIAPKADIAVYFAGAQTQDMLRALQMMIHPESGAPTPSIISISYGWGPDDLGSQNFSDGEYAQFTALFEDAATNKITVLVSSGDSGAEVESPTQAQTSYPASDIWVTACGGTTLSQSANGSQTYEWVWNDVYGGQPGATGGGVSARFLVPTYQSAVAVPARNGGGQPGRGVPDIAGNASEASGYLQVIGGGAPQPVGGTSAVAPLYAGLVARINANLGAQIGYLNTTLYGLPATVFNNVTGSAGPANNSFGHVKGYAAHPGWNPCTGLGSVVGQALQDALKAAASATPAPAPAPAS